MRPPVSTSYAPYDICLTSTSSFEFSRRCRDRKLRHIGERRTTMPLATLILPIIYQSCQPCLDSPILIGGVRLVIRTRSPQNCKTQEPYLETYSRTQAVAWASCSFTRCMCRHCSATGRTSTVTPYSSVGHSLAISSASLKSS